MPLKELDTAPELRDNPSLTGFNDVASLAKSFIDTKTHVGNSLRPPGPDASEADKKDFYAKLQKHAPHLVPLVDGDADAEKLVWSKLGRPADAKEYEYKLPDGVAVDLESLRAVATETGMTKSQFNKAAAKAVELAQKNALERDNDVKSLKTEWGAAYDKKLAEAAEAAAKVDAPEPVVKAIREGRLASAQLKLWSNLAKSLGAEGTIVGKQNGGASAGAVTPGEAELQIAEIQRNPIYWDRHAGPAREVLMKKVVELQKFITPEA